MFYPNILGSYSFFNDNQELSINELFEYLVISQKDSNLINFIDLDDLSIETLSAEDIQNNPIIAHDPIRNYLITGDKNYGLTIYNTEDYSIAHLISLSEFNNNESFNHLGSFVSDDSFYFSDSTGNIIKINLDTFTVSSFNFGQSFFPRDINISEDKTEISFTSGNDIRLINESDMSVSLYIPKDSSRYPNNLRFIYFDNEYLFCCGHDNNFGGMLINRNSLSAESSYNTRDLVPNNTSLQVGNKFYVAGYMQNPDLVCNLYKKTPVDLYTFGHSRYVSFPPTATSNWNKLGVNDFTIEFEILLTSLGGISIGNNAISTNIGFNIQHFLGNAIRWKDSANGILDWEVLPYYDGEWHHIKFKLRRGNDLQLWMDGVYYGSKPATSMDSLSYTGKNFSIGASTNGTSNLNSGSMIKNVALYDQNNNLVHYYNGFVGSGLDHGMMWNDVVGDCHGNPVDSPITIETRTDRYYIEFKKLIYDKLSDSRKILKTSDDSKVIFCGANGFNVLNSVDDTKIPNLSSFIPTGRGAIIPLLPNRNVGNILRGCIGLWRMDETSGIRNDLIGVSSLIPQGSLSSVNGVKGNAVYLDGSGYLLASDSSNFQNLDEFTISTWVKFDVLDVGFQIIVSLDSPSNEILQVRVDNNILSVLLYPSYTIVYGNIVENEWYNIIVRASSITGLFDITVNNGTTVSGTSISTINNNLAKLAIGGADKFPTLYKVIGTIDETIIWNRILTDSEIGRINTFDYGGIPQAPTGVTLDYYNNEITLNWYENTELDLSSYNIYRYYDINSKNYELIGNSLDNFYIDTDYPNISSQDIYYRVTAIDTDGNESNYSSEVLKPYIWNRLIHRWDFDNVNETYTDVVGGVQLSAYGSTMSSTTNERFTNSLNFNGIDNYLYHPSLLNYTDNESWTWAFWVSFNNVSICSVLNKYIGSSAGIITFQIVIRDDKKVLRLNVGNIEVYDPEEIVENKWYFVCGYYDHIKQEIGISIDNKPYITASSTGPNFTQIVPFEIGKIISYYMNGILDEVMIFNFPFKLTSIDVNSNILGYWRLDNPSGQPQVNYFSTNYGYLIQGGSTNTIYDATENAQYFDGSSCLTVNEHNFGFFGNEGSLNLWIKLEIDILSKSFFARTAKITQTSTFHDTIYSDILRGDPRIMFSVQPSLNFLEWNMLTITRSSSGEYKIYINGNLEYSGIDNTNFLIDKFEIGRAKDNMYFTGWMKNIALWETDLEDSYILELYQNGSDYNIL